MQLEVHQLAYDGQTFRVVKTERRLPDEMLSGWKISGGGLKNAIQTATICCWPCRFATRRAAGGPGAALETSGERMATRIVCAGRG